MRPAIDIKALAPDDAPALVALRREALVSAPLAFGSSLEDDRGLSLDVTRASLADASRFAVFGAFDRDQLFGMVGLQRLEKLKARHRAVIWGMFVAPAARRRGAGARLLDAAVERARAWPGVLQVHLSVFETAADAARLYRRAGFREWGREPRALQWDGRLVAEHHLVLELA